ncbi:MAG TPA: hydroxymethylpyrimidine/phosphomethylpyrimidine kinase [Thermopetrobacter sp.]|nr:hydroxymethylpyrimidine/phosphomethylpyrimidine kinase [Thermopetrobacter sp.]
MRGHEDTRPVVLCIGGTDPTGRAGLAADIRAGEAVGVHVAPVVATLTVQNARGLQDLHPAGALFLRRQIAAVLDDLPVRAVKTGMLADAATLEAVAAALRGADHPLPLIVDPVLRASPGGRPVCAAPATWRDALRRLCRQATLLTPNLPEAAALLGEPAASDRRRMRAQARELRARYGCAVLLKGGHLPGEGPVVDVFVDGGDEQVFLAPRRRGPSPRATGCTLATLIAAGIARGETLRVAVRRARRMLHAALTNTPSLGGLGADPVRLASRDAVIPHADDSGEGSPAEAAPDPSSRPTSLRGEPR